MRIQFHNVFCWIMQETLEMQPKKVSRERPIGRRSILQIQSLHYPVPKHAMISVGHACSTTLASFTNDSTVGANYEGLSTNIWCAVHQRSVRQETTMARAGTLPSYLYQNSCNRVSQSPLNGPGTTEKRSRRSRRGRRHTGVRFKQWRKFG